MKRLPNLILQSGSDSFDELERWRYFLKIREGNAMNITLRVWVV